MSSNTSQSGKNDPAGFLARRHAAVEIAPAMLHRLVRRAAGQDMVAYERIVRGYDNEVYAVCMENGDDLIVRIRRYGATGLAQEAWAIEQCRASGAPVPEILLLDTVEDGAGLHEVMVQRKLPGRPLSELLPGLSPAQVEHALAQAGETLSHIHSVPAGGFYKLGEDRRWDFASWDELAASTLRGRRADRQYLVQAGLAETDLDAVYSLIEAGAAELACRQPVLCHGDYKTGHLFFTDALKLSGVIDFGEFQGGQPLLDFALFEMEHPELDVRLLQAGYTDRSLFDAGFAHRLLLQKVTLITGYLAHYIREGNSLEVAKLRRQLSRLDPPKT